MKLQDKNNIKQSIKTLHHYSTSTKHLERQTTIQHLLQVFLPKQHFMFVWLNRAMTVLCQEFCYIKDTSICIVIQIIKKFAEKHGSPHESSPLQDFSSHCPSKNSDPLIVSLRGSQLLKSSPLSHIFFSLCPFVRGDTFYARLETYSRQIVN